jgi:MOSC domain-containing protein
VATVSALIRYPVKGCAGTPVSTAVLTPSGLEHDRTFMFVTPDGLFRSQRTTPRLAAIRAEATGDKLVLAAPGAADLAIDPRADGPRCPVRVHNWDGEAVEQDPDAGAWASELLGEPVRLVGQPPDHHRAVDDWHGPVSFADSTALHATSLSSLDDLNARILERGADPVPMARFRPNIVFAGWPQPYTEDTVRELTVGTTELAWVKPDIRCKVTMTDQETGERAGPEPLRTLADYRREEDGGVSFGVKLSVRRPGELSVGDEVHVRAWA